LAVSIEISVIDKDSNRKSLVPLTVVRLHNVVGIKNEIITNFIGCQAVIRQNKNCFIFILWLPLISYGSKWSYKIIPNSLQNAQEEQIGLVLNGNCLATHSIFSVREGFSKPWIIWVGC
jgi:hypothetical protein